MTFRCPRCGASHFSTRGPLASGVGRCKGHYRRDGRGFGSYDGCDFEWDRSDDALYFVPDDVDDDELTPPPKKGSSR